MAPPEAACAALARRIRRRVIERSLASSVGHIGSALSIAEVVAALYSSVLREPGTRSPSRDRFVLSKGHAVLAVYAAMLEIGRLDEAAFATFCGEGSLLGVHPEHALPGIDLSTGSLGQGLSAACGMAYALRLRGSPSRAVALLSDAECNEGQVWEAAGFAAHHALGALTAIVDDNGSQALGPTREILRADLPAQWRAFGWECIEVDGHDPAALLAALAPRPPASGAPRVVLARTVLGKGVSFMEGSFEWHYRNLTPDLAAQALAEIGGAEEVRS